MPDDTPRLSRRRLLGSIGVTGAGAALGGTGASAFLNDTERSTGNTVTAGRLDLKIDWEEHYNGKRIQTQSLTDNPGPIFELGDIKPGDYGEATISIHPYHNPAWVYIGGELTANAELGVNEPESKAEGEDDPKGENSGDAASGELADEILVDVWYDGTDGEDDGGDNEYELGEKIITCGTLRQVLEKLEDGVLLDNQVGDDIDWTNDANASGGSTTVTAEFEGAFTPGPQEEQCIEYIPCDDPDVLGLLDDLDGFTYDGEIPDGTTHVALKAANGCYIAEVGPDTTTIKMPEQGEISNDQYGEISNATFYHCPDGGNGGDPGNGGCWPNSTTQYLGFSWELPFDVGNEVQGDSVEFDLEFYAQQCRHNDNPTNPFAD